MATNNSTADLFGLLDKSAVTKAVNSLKTIVSHVKKLGLSH